MHEVVQAWKAIRLVEMQSNHTVAPSTPGEQAPLGQTAPAQPRSTEREVEQKPKERKADTLTKDELEVRGMLARGMRVTDIMKAKFGVDTYAPEKVRLRALSR